ncbi:diguanylate cyclase domain-containing protein [Sphingomonas sp. ac-8]|uniref:GGDEF domain-containing protein n=1 Tax=Sphingomonas sp. ac-8 TaxID=3242977 RepID=UPI003A800D23
MIRSMIRMAQIVCALLLVNVALARPVTTPPGRPAPLATCILPDATGTTPRALFAAPDRFDCVTPQRAFGPGDYWVLSDPLSLAATADEPLRLRMMSLWQQSVTLHILYGDGHVETFAADQNGLTRRIQLGALVEFAIPTRPAPAVRLLWHVRGAANLRGILLGPKLVTRGQAERDTLTMAAIYAGFAGLCIALIVYNLALWKALRHRFQLAYCAMLLCLLFYAVSSSGALAWLLPGIANNHRIAVNYIMLAWSAAAALAFSRSFFEARVFEGWVGRLTELSMVGMTALGVLFLLIAPVDIHVLDAFFSLSFLALVGVVVPILWRAWRRRSNYLWLFALTWASPLAMVVVRVSSNLGLLPWRFWIDNSTVVAMSSEALLTGLAIAYRIRLLSIERDTAILQELSTRRLADTDPLTGLLNRRAFLAQAVGRLAPQQLLVADVDHFKRVNDLVGHDGGDEVLRVVARTLRRTVPAGTVIARLGGEEFAILADARAALNPEALLAALRAAAMPYALEITASIGSCTGPLADEADWQRLYHHADAALFAAKHAGRDRVHWAEPTRAAA